MIPPGTDSDEHGLWEKLEPLVNDALASLAAGDRNVVALRFFEKKSHDEIAALLGVPETVARKRLSRAVERLRRFFARRGVSVTGTALLALLAAQSVTAAPAPLVAATTAAVLAQGAAVSASALALAKGAADLMAWAKLKLAAAICAVAVAVSGGVLLSDASRFRLETAQLATRFEDTGARSDGAWRLTGQSRNGNSNLFVLTSQTTSRLFPTALIARLRVTDDTGTSFDGHFEAGTFYDMAGQKRQLWQVPMLPRRGTIQPDARTLSLRFARLESRFVTFRVKPTTASSFAVK